MTETKRIRWEPTVHGGFVGHVGTLEPWVFQVFKASDHPGDNRWMLTAQLPGAVAEYRPGDDPDELKAEAERWLAEFVSSLGAIFPPGHIEGPKRMAGREMVRTCSCGKPWPCEQARWNQLREKVQKAREFQRKFAADTEDARGTARALNGVLAAMESALERNEGDDESAALGRRIAFRKVLTDWGDERWQQGHVDGMRDVWDARSAAERAGRESVADEEAAKAARED